MTWPKILRAVVACVGIGTAVALVMMTRERPPAAPPRPATTGDPAASFQSGAGDTVRHQGNRRVALLEYAKLRRYTDRVEWDDFKLSLEDGATLSANHVKGTFTAGDQEEPSAFALEGDVRFRSADGAVLTGEAGTYDENTGTATIPGAASMTRAGMTARGTGGTYERGTGAFKLAADATVTMPAAADATPITASSSAMTMVGGGATLLLEERARIARASETMTANRATLYLSGDQQQIRTIELRGAARVQPASKGSDIPEMAADDMELEFYDGGTALQRAALHRQASMIQTDGDARRTISGSEIGFRTAPDGRTLTRLDASERVSVSLPPSPGVAARTITAAKLAASGTERTGLTTAVFEGGVEFVESSPPRGAQAAFRRVGRAQRLSMTIKGRLDVIESALFERDVRFTSNDVVGVGDLGDYRAERGELELRPAQNSTRRARVEDGGVIVEAAESIVVNLETDDLHARRNVTTVSRQQGSKTPGATLFDPGQPLYGTAAEFWYESAADRFRYVGDEKTRAQLKQTEDSLILGREIVFQQRTQDLVATGQAESTFTATSGKATTPVRYRATAVSIHYDDANRMTTLRGGPATLRTADDETIAEVVALTLAKTSRTLERMEATGAVRTSVQQGRQALGERLIYDAIADTYQLWGKPLTLWTRESDGSCVSQSGNFVRISGDVGAPEFPSADNPAGATSTPKLECPPFLAVRK